MAANKSGNKEHQYSMLTHLSFSVEGMLNNFVNTAYNIRVFAFFQIAMKLEIEKISLAIIIYAVWNMINDPLIGYISDRNTKFLKFGRRYPLITIGTFMIGFSYLLIFVVPNLSQWFIFAWLILSACLFDMLFSLWTNNYLSLMSAKFDEKERKRIGAINALFGIFGVTAGMMVPALLLENYTDQSSYIYSASWVAGIAIVLAILMQFGIRENDELKKQAEKNYNQPKFTASLKMCLKSKNFLAHVAFTLGQGVLTTLMLGSLQYWNQFIIGSSEAFNEILVGGALLGGSVVSIPIWFLIDKRIGTRKSMYIGGFFTSAMLLGFYFFGTTLNGGILFAGLIGVSLGSMWTNLYVSLADVIMEFNATYGTFSEGVWTGVRMFFNRLSFVVQSISILVIQKVTGFNENLAVQGDDAKVGLRVIMAVIPCIFYFLGALLMLVWYDLTPEKLATLQKEE